MLEHREIRHFHLFCGLGAGAKGFNRGHARVGNLEARFRCIGGVDVDPAAIADFGRLAGTPGTVLDMFDRDQYIAFHGKEPPADWRESTPADIQAAAGNENPHIVFLSAPCKGFSGLLSQSRSTTPKYQALNRLTLRGMWLALEAFADDPPELIIFENVPRIANRGRPLLDQIVAMLEHYGYHVAETTHDCGELGGLAQSRKRFLLVARHAEKVPPFLYEPVKRPLRAVGDVLGDMPLPGDELAGAMHRVPRLQWKTWVRLAFVEAGSDWRSLNKLAVEDGNLRDYLIVPEGRNNGYLGVHDWQEAAGTVAGASRPGNGKFSVADPRFDQSAKWKDGQAYGVRRWDGPTGAITSQKSPGQGAFAVADPRQAGPSFGKYMVTRWDEHAGTVISGSTTGQGAYAVADPRPGMRRSRGDNYLTGGHYGVVPWSSSCGAVSASARQDNGFWSVADPRLARSTLEGEYLPAAAQKLVAVIRALDGTWHRPFTTLELAALQGLIEPTEHLELAGLSDSDWRERIGNAVPPPASEAIAGVMGTTLLLAWTGETFALGSTPIWVRQAAAGLSLSRPDQPVAH
ncbi:DNA cytosine methyltransferase [Chromohalobacter sp. TMW 2.2308]|uniref:DNA cytosine methyltransferase n=1 Tax=Chromohalobacter TaxID=42054 RepID=UPI001FFDB164|nr:MULTISPECIES: DNA cytosine methyltransferase [Chromohalobacter]MCK2042522.1 DNA cytosine methyltransferase [Chromohalobacter moromii]MCT8514959.1 DNA cytosine methyltransferase [Chromohalobacter sp. TMW 2.2271]